jgi:hypothetical protein
LQDDIPAVHGQNPGGVKPDRFQEDAGARGNVCGDLRPVHPETKRRQRGQGQGAEHSGEKLVPAVFGFVHDDPLHAKGFPAGIENGRRGKTHMPT